MNHSYATKFLIHKAARRRSTLAVYRTGLNRYCEFAGAAWPPTAETIGGFLDHCRQEGYKENSIHGYFRILKTYCLWLHRAGHITTNPIPLVDTPRQPGRNIPRAPRPGELYRFFCFLEDRLEAALLTSQLAASWEIARDLAVYSLILDTGLRLGEVAGLQLSDLDLPARTVLVRHSKTGAQRIVPFGTHTKGDLSLWLKVRAGLALPAGLTACFVGKEHRRDWRAFGTWGIRGRMRVVCQAAGVELFTPHSLRHAFASQSLANGASLEDLRVNLGHANLKTTSIYTMGYLEQRAAGALKTSPRSNQKR